MKVTIDRDDCILCGACWVECPDFFEEGLEDSLSQVAEAHRVDGDPSVGQVPEGMVDCVRDAAAGCPVEIIHIEE